MSIIKGTRIRCKDDGVIKDNFIKVPYSIFDYIELGLISGNDLTIWIKLYQLDNGKLGYAFPTIEQLMIYTNLGKKTVINCLKTLQRVGLIKKEKSTLFPNKNIYHVYKPLEQSELYALLPELKKELEDQVLKYQLQAAHDKDRLLQLFY